MFCTLSYSAAAAFLVVLITNLLSGQRVPRASSMQPQLHGQVRYAASNRPAEFVLVRLEAPAGGGVSGQTMTDREGRFSFLALTPAQYILTIHAPGYRDVQQVVDLLTAPNAYVNANLVRDVDVPERSLAYVDASVPADARKEFEKGESALAEGKPFKDIAGYFEKALTLYPKFFEAALRLGTVYMDLAEWDKAEVTLKRAVEIKPKMADALFALGELYLQKGRTDDAEKRLREGLQLENRSWKAHFALARVYWKRGDLVNTARQVALTLQLNPDHQDAHLLAGNIFTRKGLFNDAMLEFNEYLRLAPKGPYAQEVRASIKRIKQRLTVPK